MAHIRAKRHGGIHPRIHRIAADHRQPAQGPADDHRVRHPRGQERHRRPAFGSVHQQYENAQRIDELGFGVRLNTYGFADAELTDAVDKILADTEEHIDFLENQHSLIRLMGAQNYLQSAMKEIVTDGAATGN